MRTTTPHAQATAAPPPPEHAHSTDPDLAAVLFSAWSGDPLTCVSSPPGAGKTRLITHLAHQLQHRAGLRVTVAAQTRAQAHDVASRIAALGAEVTLLDGAQETRPLGLHPGVQHRRGDPGRAEAAHVLVATTARWLWTTTDLHAADLLLIDEAYQLTYADLAALGSIAPQAVLVGDPGQISPVVTGRTTRWDNHPGGPHVPAPTALAATHPDQITHHRLARTWRCGPQTTALVQPICYPDLPFTSARPPIHLTSSTGTTLPELCTDPLVTTSELDPAISARAAEHVRDLLTHTVTDQHGTRPLAPEDVAVVTPHVTQASGVAAHTADLPGLLIGTANAVQGTERHAVVVIHPLTGHHEATPFATDLGRTCVALTRHRTHARIITDPRASDVLRHATDQHPGNPTLQAQQTLLRSLAQHTP